jgi:hypothetical protein
MCAIYGDDGACVGVGLGVCEVFGAVVVGGVVVLGAVEVGAVDDVLVLGDVDVLVVLGGVDGVPVDEVEWLDAGAVGCRFSCVDLWCDPLNAAPRVVRCPLPDSDFPSAASIPVTIPTATANVATAPTPASAHRRPEPDRTRGDRVCSAGSAASGLAGVNSSSALRTTTRPRSTECSYTVAAAPLIRLTSPVPASVPATPSREDRAAAVTAASVPAISLAALSLRRGLSSDCSVMVLYAVVENVLRASNDEDVRILSPVSLS